MLTGVVVRARDYVVPDNGLWEGHSSDRTF